MKTKTITDKLSVSGQIMPTDISDIAKAGFKSIIVNRPDGEGADQPRFAEIETAANIHGIKVAYIPVVSGNMTDADATLFGKAVMEMPGPVLAFCRSGARSSLLWEMSQRFSATGTGKA